MSAIARERRRRRAARLHAVLPRAAEHTWQVAVVLGSEGADMSRVTRALVGAGWQSAQRDEEDRRVVIVIRELPVGGDDHHSAQAAVDFLAMLRSVITAEPELLDGTSWLDDVILIPPGAIDSDADLLWLDPADGLAQAWAEGNAPGALSACTSLQAQWLARSAAGDPAGGSLADALF